MKVNLDLVRLCRCRASGFYFLFIFAREKRKEWAQMKILYWVRLWGPQNHGQNIFCVSSNLYDCSANAWVNSIRGNRHPGIDWQKGKMRERQREREREREREKEKEWLTNWRQKKSERRQRRWSHYIWPKTELLFFPFSLQDGYMR